MPLAIYFNPDSMSVAKYDEIMKKLEFSHGHNMLMLTGLVRLPGLGARLSPYAGLGGGVLLVNAAVVANDHELNAEDGQISVRVHKKRAISADE